MKLSSGIRSGCSVVGLVLAAGLAGTGSAMADCQWGQVNTLVQPSERHGHAMVYDSSRDAFVVLGGRDTRPPTAIWYTETWEFDGFQFGWVQKPSIGISTNGLAQMGLAYDSVRSRTVLFGYGHSAGRSGETWEYDGNGWMQAFVSGAGFRNRGAMTFDAARGVSVYFGGESAGNNPQGDTWEFNGTSWSMVAASGAGPSPRFAHAMTYDAARGVVVLFGGRDRAGSPDGMNDTWTWDGQTWTLAATTGPSPRQFATMAYHADAELVVLFGGWNGTQDLGDTWHWDGTEWTFSTDSGPAPRRGHAMAGGSFGRVVLFGGNDSAAAAFNDTWVYECSTTQPCYADCMNSGLLNIDQFLCFINEFSTAQALPSSQQITHYANCDGSTTEPVLTIDDFLCFINEFALGCP